MSAPLVSVAVTKTGWAAGQTPAALAAAKLVEPALRQRRLPRFAEKLPERSAAVGTVEPVFVIARLVRRTSSEKKKKVRSRPLQYESPPSPKRGSITGPLKVPPKLCHRSFGTGALGVPSGLLPRRLFAKLFALNLLWRTKS